MRNVPPPTPESAELKSLHLYCDHLQGADRFARLALKYSEEFDEETRELMKTDPRATRLEYDGDREIIRIALNVALFISYSVPFKHSNTRIQKDTLESLPKKYIEFYGDDQRALHDMIIKERDKGIAHIDADRLKPELVISEGSQSIAWHSSGLLSTPELLLLMEMIEGLLNGIFSAIQELTSLIP